MSSITTGGGINGLFCLGFFAEPLATKCPANAWLLVLAFLLSEHLTVRKISKWAVVVVTSLSIGLLIGTSSSIGFKRISLKVPTSTPWLLFNANLLISRNWFLLWAFLRVLSSFSAFFFSASAPFFIRALVFGVALPWAMNYWSQSAVIRSSIFFIFLKAQRAWRLVFLWVLNRSQKSRLISIPSGGRRFICKHWKVSSTYLAIPCQDSKKSSSWPRVVSNPLDFAMATR